MAEAGARPTARLVAAMALASALMPLNSTMLSVALRPIGEAFHSSERELTQALVTTYLATSIAMQAPGGRIGDRLGHRRALALGQAVFAVAACLGALGPALGWLVVSRVAMAAAGGLVVPSAMALLRTELPPELRGRAFGAFGATMALAAAIGPLLGGQIVVALGWRGVFAVSLVVLPISALLAGRPPRVAAAAAPAEGRAPARGWFVDLGLLRIPVFVASASMIALHNLAMYALLFEVPSVCAVVLGASADESGRLLVALMAPMVVLSPIAGRLTDGLGARRVALTGAVSALLGVAALYFTPLSSLWAPVPGLALFGVGLALSGPPSQSAGMSAVAADRSGVAAGMMSTMRYLGGIAGTISLAVLLAPTSDPAVAAASHRRALLVFGAALVVAVGCALRLPPRAVSGRPYKLDPRTSTEGRGP